MLEFFALWGFAGKRPKDSITANWSTAEILVMPVSGSGKLVLIGWVFCGLAGSSASRAWSNVDSVEGVLVDLEVDPPLQGYPKTVFLKKRGYSQIKNLDRYGQPLVYDASESQS